MGSKLTSNNKIAQAHTRLGYLPALDGLRAIAVTGVLLYHAELDQFLGGFLGVDVFFVISGYLITSLLLGELKQTGKVNLASFWLRRARRLLPALFLLLAAVLIYAVLFLPDELANLRDDAGAAFGYFTNWYLIFNSRSYFETVGRPSLLQHLWSLAVEEQFYLIWPIIFVALMTFARRFALPIVLLGIAASSGLMALLYSPDVDPSRVYYGTDTRAAGLLAGVALAYILSSMQKSGQKQGAIKMHRSIALDLVGFGALFIVLAFFMQIDETQPFLYQGGFTILEIVVAILIATLVLPGARLLPRLLGSKVPRWIGLRSYGIYLWHWPVFMLTRPQLDLDMDGAPLLALRIVITLVLAELSYRFVETPIRNGALKRGWEALRAPTNPRKRLAASRALASVLLIVALVISFAPSIVSAQPPPPPDYLAVQEINTVDSPSSDADLLTPTPEAGVADNSDTPDAEATAPDALPTTDPHNIAGGISEEGSQGYPDESTETDTVGSNLTPLPVTEPTISAPTVEVTGATPTTVVTSDTTTTTALATQSPPQPTPVPLPAAEVAGLGRVVAIGDSVMLGAAGELRRQIPGIQIDAKVARQATATIALLKTYRDTGKLGPIVILHVGTNGTFTAKQFDQIMDVLSGQKWVIFVNLKVPRSWETSNDKVIQEGVARYPNAILVDWHTASVTHKDYFAKDLYHLQPKGQRVYAALIGQALAGLVGK